jgi:hypothetical protein
LARVQGVFGVRVRVLAFRENARGLNWGLGVSVAVANPHLPFLNFQSPLEVNCFCFSEKRHQRVPLEVTLEINWLRRSKSY